MKKRRVLALIAMLCMLVAAVCGAAACGGDEHEHSFGDWTITVQPTLETGGKATHKCTEDDFSEEVDIPALTDALWTKSVKTPATHAAEGVDTYTSSYGSVDVPSAKLAEHTYGPWTLTKKPTLTEVGTAERACTVHSDVKDVKNDVPALSDASVWTKDEENSTPASHTAEGKDVYTSEYGEVEVTLEKTGEHVWSSWSWKDGKEPTLTEGATAVRSCTLSGCTETEEKTVSNLTDTDVWTKDEEASKAPTHTAKGTDVYKSEYGTVEVEVPEKADEHTWGPWTLTKEPTLTETGTAERTCTAHDTVKDTKNDVPNLSDATVWTKDATKSQAATHTAEGKDVYTSEYGEVEVKLDKVGDHQWGAWTWKDGVEPTEQTGATAVHSCTLSGCTEKEEKSVPKLTDDSVWTCEDHSSYNGKGNKVYTSEYGTFTVETEKLVAPYDSKTYYGGIAVEIYNDDDDTVKNGVPGITDTWNNSITLDANGVGVGAGSPFNTGDQYQFRMVDPKTGKIEIISIDGTTAEDGSIDYENGETKTVTAYVDFVSGIIIMPRIDDLTYFELVSPYGAYSKSGTDITVALSSWGTGKANYGVAISYTYKVDGEPKTVHAVILNGVVTFGVEFTDLAGAEVKAEECYHAPVLYIKKGAETLASLGYNGTTMVALDGYEGVYTDATLGKVTLSGFGTLTTDNGGTGTYTITGTENTLDLIVTAGEETKAYIATVDRSAKTMTATAAEVTVTFEMKGHGSQNAKKGYKNVEMQLPEPVDETGAYLFRGWYTDDALETPVSDPFKPAGDTVLYAKWVEKITVKVFPDPDGEQSEDLEVGVGDNILESLKKFPTDAQGDRMFMGWQMKQGETVRNLADYPDTKYASGNNNALELHSVWEEIPYVGTFNGSEIWNAGSGGSGGITITITADGKISGDKEGTVVDYNKETQLITWTDASGSNNYFFFDEASGVLAYNYGDSVRQYLSNDMYVLSKYAATDGKIANKYGVQATSKHDDSRNYYAQFVEIETKTGKKTVFFYETIICSDVTVTDAFGSAIDSINSLKASKSVVVKDSKGNVLLGVASQGESFEKKSDTVDLDALLGTYTKEGADDLTLDGVGNLKLGEKTGTYEKTAEDNKIDAYVAEGDTIVYYEVTLSGTTYESTKVMVDLTFNYGLVTDPEGKPATTSYNKNIETVLPDLTDPSGVYLFRGWYSDEAFGSELNKDGNGHYVYKPTGAATLYAKWVKKVTIHVHLGDGETLPEGTLGEDGTITAYGQGEEVTLARPVKDGGKFEGWYTDELHEHAWGELGEDGLTTVTLGTDITELHLYPKWGEAPIYSHYYYAYEIGGTNANGGHFTSTSTDDSHKVDIDPDGNGVASSISPFRGNLKIEWVDEGSYKLKFVTDGSFSSTYYAYIDPISKLIIMNSTSDYNGQEAAEKFDEVYLLSYMEKEGGFIASHIRSSYWNEGMSRVISYTPEDGQTYNIFVHNNKVYFNVSFKDGLDDSAADVNADTAYQASKLYIFDSEGEEIARFGHNGTTMVELDGNEGTYTLSGDNVDDLPTTLTLNGVATAKFGEDKDGSYVVVSDGVVGIYLDGKYYEATLDKTSAKTYTITKPMLSVTFTSEQGLAYGDGQTLANGDYNKNIEVHIPALKDTDTHVFRGWYTTADFRGDPLRSDEDGYLFTPEGNGAITLYAKWLEKVTITVHYGENLEDKTFTYGKGEAGYPEKPGYTNGKIWDGWYTDATDRTETHLWTEGTAVDGNLELWVNWTKANILYGEWQGKNVFGSSNGTGASNQTLSVTTKGATKGQFTATFQSYDSATGRVIFVASSKYYYGLFDETSGILVVNYNSTESAEFVINSDINVFMKNVFNVPNNLGLTESYKNRVFTINDINVLIYNNALYANVTYKAADGTVINAADLSNKTEFKIYNSSDEFIVGFAKQSGDWISLDGYEGDYTKGSGDIDLGTITLDGHGGVTGADSKKGTYLLVSGQEYTAELTYDGAFYLVTLDKDAKHYSATQPMVSVTFSSAQGFGYDENQTWGETQSFNKNAQFVIPALDDTDEYVFRGWYTDEECSTGKLSTNGDGDYVYTPTEDGITLYAKWLKKVTVHVDYQKEGVENYDLVLGEGEEATPKEPPFTDGQVFKAWHLGTADGDVWTSGTEVSEDITLYCEWQGAHALYGEWAGKEYDSSTASGGNEDAGSSTTLNVDAYGKISGDYSRVSGTIKNYDPATGKFTLESGYSGTYYFAADAKNGVLIAPWSANQPTGNDWYVLVNKAKSATVTFGDNSYWKGAENGSVRLIEVTLDSDEKMIIYISDGRVWGNVSFVATDAEGNAVALNDVYKDAQTIVIRDSEGEIIEGWKRGDSGLEKSVADGYEGEYTVEGGTITLDGFGGIKTDINGAQKSGTYEAPAEGSAYTFDVYLENGTETYELTVNKGSETKSATLTAAKVTISFTIKESNTSLTQASMTVYKNVSVELPTTANETEIIAGWYVDEACTETPVTLVDGKYIPTASITLYAKAVQKITVTIHWGEHGANANGTTALYFPLNAVPDLTAYKPSPDGNWIFEGWYNEAEYSTQYVPAALTQNIDVYCKWMDEPYTVESVNLDYNKGNWTETEAGNGVWKVEGQGSQNKAALKITFKASGTFTFNFECSITDTSEDFLAYGVNPSNPSTVWSTYNARLFGSGTKSVTVKAGDVLYIGYYNFTSASSSDYAQVSNFKLA